MTNPSEKKVTFQPSGRAVYVLPGTTLFEAAARAGLLLQTPCGGKGTCGKCRVRVHRGACKPSQACRSLLSETELKEGIRLACQAKVTDDCVVEIPESSLFETTTTQILTAGDKKLVELQPSVWKKYVKLEQPTLEHPVGDLRRLEEALGHRIEADIHALRSLPTGLREAAFEGTAVVCCNQLIAIEKGDTTEASFGVAFDLGTTTVVGVLMDLHKGRDQAVSATVNPQVASGDDVISRILRVRKEPNALDDMHESILNTLNELVRDLADKSNVPLDRIYEVVITGNTTMQHIFCGISPAALGEVPFTPAYNRGLFLHAEDVGLKIHPNGSVYVFPNIGGFVGGDTVAGILAATMHVTDKPLILVDIGTNGEIVLAHNGRLLATSTAAGPAFEGARITNGMRATEGAIEKVVYADGDLSCNVIGNVRPRGLCGTALIDVTAELLRLGVLDSTGRIRPPEDLPETVPQAVTKRLVQHDDTVDFTLVSARDSGTDEAICLYQKDVRELQLASGAIRAGIGIMLRKAGLAIEDVHEVLLAGAFGNFIRRRNARRIGLLPPLPQAQIRFIGNAASMGAKAVLLSRNFRALADDIALKAEHVDLSSDPEFQMEFGMAMMFPDQELAD